MTESTSDKCGEENFREWLKRNAYIRGLTLADIARRIGVSKHAIYNWNNGKRIPSKDVLTRIDEVFAKDKIIFEGEFSAWLREKMRGKWTANALANAIGVSGAAVGYWMSGKNIPSANKLKLLHEVLDRDIVQDTHLLTPPIDPVDDCRKCQAFAECERRKQHELPPPCEKFTLDDIECAARNGTLTELVWWVDKALLQRIQNDAAQAS